MSFLERLMGPNFRCSNRLRPSNQYDPKVVTKLLNNYRSHPKIIKVSCCCCCCFCCCYFCCCCSAVVVVAAAAVVLLLLLLLSLLLLFWGFLINKNNCCKAAKMYGSYIIKKNELSKIYTVIAIGKVNSFIDDQT